MVPGVVVDAIVIEDIDGDGVTELVYNVRDPEQDFRSFVRIRDANTGEIEAEIADTWCVDAVILGLEEQWALLTYSAPNGAMPERGDLSVRNLKVQKFERNPCITWCPLMGSIDYNGPTTCSSMDKHRKCISTLRP